MRPDGIVVFDCVGYGFASGLDLTESDIEAELYFEDTVDPFGDGIFIRVAILCHRDGGEVISEHGDIVRTAVLQSSIGMMDQVLPVGECGLANSHLERI